jgi:hypothetical protein
MADTPDGDGARPKHLRPRRKRIARQADGEKFARPGSLAEARREIHRKADVVVAIDDQHLALRDSAANGERLRFISRDEFGNCGDDRADLGADDECSVAEPLADQDASSNGNVARERPEVLKRFDCGVFTSVGTEASERTQIDECERALHERLRVGDLIWMFDAL